MVMSCTHPIKVAGIPTATNTRQSSAIHPLTVVNVHHLENKARYILCFQTKNVIIISLRTGGQFGVYVWEGEIRLFQVFFLQSPLTFITNAFIWKEKSKREIREISDGTGRGTVVVLGEIVLSFCISWGVLQWVQGLVFRHHGLSICEDGSVVFFGILLSCLCVCVC